MCPASSCSISDNWFSFTYSYNNTFVSNFFILLLQSTYIWISKKINILQLRERLETFLIWEKHGKISTESKENNLLCLYCPWLCVPTFEIPRQIERQRGLKRDPENKIGGGGEGDTSVVTNIVKCKFLTVLSCLVSNKNFFLRLHQHYKQFPAHL